MKKVLPVQAAIVLVGRVLILMLYSITQPTAAAGAALDDCAQALKLDPSSYDNWICYFAVAKRTGEWHQTSQVLDSLGQLYPGIPWLNLIRGYVATEAGEHTASVAFLQSAANEFMQQGEQRGEMLARINLHHVLIKLNRPAAAVAQLPPIQRIGATADDPELKLRALVLQVRHNLQTGAELEPVLRELQTVLEQVDDIDSVWLRVEVFNSMALLHLSLGQYGSARANFQRVIQEAESSGDISALALAKFNLANAQLERLLEEPELGDAGGLLHQAREALQVAMQSKNTAIIAGAHRLLGELLFITQPEQASVHLDACARIAQERSEAAVLSECLWLAARIAAQTDAAAGQTLMQQALALLEEADDLPRQAFAWQHYMRLSWQAQPPKQALATSEQALQAIELLRDLQSGETRAALLSAWTRDYQWLAGRLLQEAQCSAEPQVWLQHAFAVMERARARSLREQIAASIKQNSTLPLTAIDLPTIQRGLRSDEAMLLVQSGSWQTVRGEFGGGAWAMILLPNRSTLIALPDRQDLVTLSQALNDASRGNAEAVPGRNGSLHAQLSSKVYRKVLAPVIDQLPRSTRSLIIITDGPMQQMPFATLRPDPNAAPLASRYQLSFAPSASLWFNWRNRLQTPDTRPSLVVANPEGVLPLAASAQSELPYSDFEGTATAAYLGDSSVLMRGPHASEAGLRATDLRSFALLHFASHLVLDTDQPDRSSLVLAPGNQREDGLLQYREILDLDLRDPIVVLSSCDSANGAQIRGEGVIGLARAFFAAGARTVVGSLWPVRDDYAAAFFESFYEALGKGSTVAQSSQWAQQQLQSQGYPAEAWAGFVVMGDGSAALLPTSSPTLDRALMLTTRVIGIALAMLLMAYLLVRRRRRGT